jgi:hypothetical protein
MDIHIRSVRGRYKRAAGERAQTLFYISGFKVYNNILSRERETETVGFRLGNRTRIKQIYYEQ